MKSIPAPLVIEMLERLDLVTKQAYLGLLGIRTSVPLDSDLGKLLRAVNHQVMDAEMVIRRFMESVTGSPIDKQPVEDEDAATPKRLH